MQPQSDIAAPRDRTLACVRCGYDLRGLELEHPCPECGVPVRASASQENLRYAAPHWLRSLRTGLTLLLVSMGLLAGMWGAWCVLGLIEVRLRGTAPVADAFVQPTLGLSLACAVAGVVGALLAFRRDPGDRRLRRGPTSRSISVILAATSGVVGVLALVPGLLIGRAGPSLLIVLLLCLSGLSISAIPTLATLARRSPARKPTTPRALAILVAGTELLAFIYALGLALLPRASFGGCCGAMFFMTLVIAIPASTLFYLQFLWRALCAVRAALKAQNRAGPLAP
jgi:hypothetical protein